MMITSRGVRTCGQEVKDGRDLTIFRTDTGQEEDAIETRC
jgi:hypothetical protein